MTMLIVLFGILACALGGALIAVLVAKTKA